MQFNESSKINKQCLVKLLNISTVIRGYEVRRFKMQQEHNNGYNLLNKFVFIFS